MNEQSMARLCPKLKEEIKKYQIAPNESYNNILLRLFGLRRIPKSFKFKGKKQ